MIKILPVDKAVQQKIDRHNLRKKFEKQLTLLQQNPYHPSLHVELLEPSWKGVRSFRVDRKYRDLFLAHATQEIEIIAITVHYQ